MLKRLILLFMGCSLVIFSGCGSTQAKKPPVPMVDYVELIANSEAYDGQRVQTFGCIGLIDSKDGWIRFSDRLGGIQKNLYIYTKNKEDVEHYKADDCVIVEGIYSQEDEYALKNARIVSSGEEAQALSDAAWSDWMEVRSKLAKDIPVTDYMSIIEDPDAYEGDYVRVSGQVSLEDDEFESRDHRLHKKWAALGFSLRGVPEDMWEKYDEADGTYIIISGKVTVDGTPKLIDCWIEEFGEEAEKTDAMLADAYKLAYAKSREEYIAECASYSYEELARLPDKYKDQPIAVSGIVYQIDDTPLDPIILVDVGGVLVYVEYSGLNADDPLILQGDPIIFYGNFLGQKTYLTVLGSNNTVPYMDAYYSSMNIVEPVNNDKEG